MSTVTEQSEQAKTLAIEIQLSARRGTLSGEQVNRMVEALLDAADTILQLRDDLQMAHSENAKLRELVRMMLSVAGVAEYATDAEWQTITHYLRELGIEVDDAS
jgi:hypothetical protein